MTAIDGESLRATFRSVMAEVCTPVAVISAMDAGRPHGTTVSAFASLSMEPPMMLVSLGRTSDLLRIVQRTGCFGVNVLGLDNSALALKFGRKGLNKFEGVRWTYDHGAPRIAGVPGWLACSVSQLVEGGDHVVVLGEVVTADSADGAPLTYHARRFGTHAPTAERHA